jgi:hypothetical protein
MHSERQIRSQLGWNLVWPEGEQLIVRRIRLAGCLDIRTMEIRVWHPIWRSVRNQAWTQIKNQALEDYDDRGA